MAHVSTQSGGVQAVWKALWRRPGGRWPMIRWGLMLLLPLALILWGLSLVLAPDDPPLLTIHIESQVTSERIPGASVRVGDLHYASDVSGEIRIPVVPAGTTIVASANGHETMEKHVPDSGSGEMTLSLSGVLVVGSLRDAVSDEPIAGAQLTVTNAAGRPVENARTDDAGNFIFKSIPEDGQLVVMSEVYGAFRQAIGDQRTLVVLLDPPRVSGQVVNDRGRPIPGAEVSGEEVSVRSDPNGRFVLDGIGQGSELTVASASDGQVTLVVEGTELGVIVLHDDVAEPLASPEGGDG